MKTTILEEFAKVQQETRKLKALVDYQNRGLLTDDEKLRLEEERVANGLSACCGARITSDYARCSACGEQS